MRFLSRQLAMALAVASVCSALGQSLPRLSGPFTMEFKLTAADPRSSEQFMQDELKFKDSMSADVKAGHLSPAHLASMLEQRKAEFEQRKQGNVSYLTLSSEGENILVLAHADPGSDAPISSASLIDGGKFYSYLPPNDSSTAGMHVLSPADFPISQPVPFIGYQLPGLPPLLRLSPKNAGMSGSAQVPVEIEIQAEYTGGQPRYVPGEVTLRSGSAENLSVASLIYGSAKAPHKTFDLGGFGQSPDPEFPKTIKAATYENIDPSRPTQIISYDLQSFKREALPHEFFLPEHYLPSRATIEYEPSQVGGKLLMFSYAKEGGSIEDQAKKQSELEARIQQRRQRAEVPKGSYAGIFAIVGGGGVLLLAYRFSRRRA